MRWALLLVILSTRLGIFECPGLVCTGPPGLEGYWVRDLVPVNLPPATTGSLLITAGHVPWGVLRCELRERERDTGREVWGCG